MRSHFQFSSSHSEREAGGEERGASVLRPADPWDPLPGRSLWAPSDQSSRLFSHDPLATFGLFLSFLLLLFIVDF